MQCTRASQRTTRTSTWVESGASWPLWRLCCQSLTTRCVGVLVPLQLVPHASSASAGAHAGLHRASITRSLSHLIKPFPLFPLPLRVRWQSASTSCQTRRWRPWRKRGTIWSHSWSTRQRSGSEGKRRGSSFSPLFPPICPFSSASVKE